MNEDSYEEKAQLNKCDLSARLNAGWLSVFLTATGRLFRTSGPQTENARFPNSVRVRRLTINPHAHYTCVLIFKLNSLCNRRTANMWWWRRRRWWWWWWWWWWLWLCKTSFISIIVVKWWKTSSLACVKSTTLTAVASPRRPLYDAPEPHRDEVRSTPTSSVPSVQCELISFESSSTTWRHRSVRRRARAQKWRRAAERLKEQSKITTETRRRATRRDATRRPVSVCRRFSCVIRRGQHQHEVKRSGSRLCYFALYM